MTEKEAVKIRSAYSNGFEYPFGNGSVSDCDMDEVNRHAEILDVALKKQIPVKPKIKRKYPYCPCCNTLLDYENYCYICGQALDWSNTE